MKGQFLRGRGCFSRPSLVYALASRGNHAGGPHQGEKPDGNQLKGLSSDLYLGMCPLIVQRDMNQAEDVQCGRCQEKTNPQGNEKPTILPRARSGGGAGVILILVPLLCLVSCLIWFQGHWEEEVGGGKRARGCHADQARPPCQQLRGLEASCLGDHPAGVPSSHAPLAGGRILPRGDCLVQAGALCPRPSPSPFPPLAPTPTP